MTPISTRRQRRQNGNTLVETALGFLPLLAIILGIADMSRLVFLNNVFQNAVREGTRYAITYNTTYNGTTYTTQTDAIRAVVQSFSMGFLTGQTGLNYIKVNYYLPNNLSTPATASSLPQTMPNGVVVNYLNQTGNVVEVQVQNYLWNWIAPLPGFMPQAGISLTASSSDVMQGLPVGTFTPPNP